MQQISGRDAALAVLNDASFVVPPVPLARAGVAWLRATVGRFSAGEAHERRRALSVAIIDAIPLESLWAGDLMHPVALLAREMGAGEMGAGEPVVDLVRDVAQAYQPGTGDEARADAAVDRLVLSPSSKEPIRMSDFATLHRAGDPLILPNVWDVATARGLVEAGFPALGTTSLGVAAANGLPDGAGATDAGTLRLTRSLANLPVDLTVDIETGSVGAAVAVAAAGAAGVNMEDAMRPAAVHAALIRSVKREIPHLFVNARTDTHWQRPGDLAEALRRVRLYADAGADGVFVPGLSEPADIEAVVAAVDVPVNVVFLPDRHTVAALTDLGVRRISTGSLLFRAALAASVETALAVRDGSPVRANLPSYAKVNAGEVG